MTNFLTRDNMNINVAMTGDVEDTEYRYQVFSGYRSWVANIFRAYPGPQYSPNWEVRVRIFSEAKDKAIALILAVREEAANKVSNSVTNYEEAALALLALSKKQKAENEELRALLAAKDAQIVEVKAEVTTQKANNKSLQYSLNKAVIEVERKNKELNLLRRIVKQSVLNKLFTKEARTVAQSVK